MFFLSRMAVGFRCRKGSQGVSMAWWRGLFTEGVFIEEVEGVERGVEGTSDIHVRVWYRVAKGFLVNFAQ